jgi:hypothetical protein
LSWRFQRLAETLTDTDVHCITISKLWRLINFRLFCSDDCRWWPRDEKINNHGCWGKHGHIPDNDYWGICLFHVVWTFFFFWCNYSSVVHTEYIVLVWFFLLLPLLLLLSKGCPDHNFFVFLDRSIIFGMWVHDHKAVCHVP